MSKQREKTIGSAPYWSRVINSIRNNDMGSFEAVLKDQPGLIEETNEIQYSNWFSGKGATLLQLVTFLRPRFAQSLMSMGVDVDMHSACALGDIDSVDKALELDSMALDRRVGQFYPIQYTLRHMTCKQNIRCVRDLLVRGDNPNRPIKRMAWFEWEDQAVEKGRADWRLIHMVALRGNSIESVKVATHLKEFGATLGAFAAPFGETALHIAATYNGNYLIHWLIENGVAVDIGSINSGETSSSTDLFDVTSYKPFTSYNKTPLMLALGEGQSKAVGSLLSAGASVNARDSEEFTPMHYAAGAFYTENLDHVKLLLQRGALSDSRGGQSIMPIELAEKKGYSRTVELLHRAKKGA